MRFVSDLLTQPLRVQPKGGVFTNQIQIQWVCQLQLLVVIAHERIKGIPSLYIFSANGSLHFSASVLYRMEVTACLVLLIKLYRFVSESSCPAIITCTLLRAFQS